MVASDNCKISKALPSAVGLKIRQPDGAACARKCSKAGRNHWVNGKEEDTDINDTNGNQKHKVYSSVEASTDIWLSKNPSSRKTLGEEDKAMGSQPICLRMPRERHYGRFRDCLQGQTNPVLNLLLLPTTLGFHIHKMLIITGLISKKFSKQ